MSNLKTESLPKEIESVRNILIKNIISQEPAINDLIECLLYSRVDLNTRATAGNLLFLGDPASGKTHTAQQFAIAIGCKDFVRIDCGEFSGHASDVSGLIGAPPGYVGHGITPARLSNAYLEPYRNKHNETVICFDEIEQATPELYGFLLALFDAGQVTLRDSSITKFHKTFFILTSNLGVDELVKFNNRIGLHGKELPNTEAIITKAVKKKFSPAFISRLDYIIPFNKLTKEDLLAITKLHIRKVQAALIEKHKIVLLPGPGVLEFVLDIKSKHGRDARRAVEQTITSDVAKFVHLFKGSEFKIIYCTVSKGKLVYNLKTQTNDIDVVLNLLGDYTDEEITDSINIAEFNS